MCSFEMRREGKPSVAHAPRNPYVSVVRDFPFILQKSGKYILAIGMARTCFFQCNHVYLYQ